MKGDACEEVEINTWKSGYLRKDSINIFTLFFNHRDLFFHIYNMLYNI